MGPFRIVILAFLFYLLCKVLFAKKNTIKSGQARTRRPSSEGEVNDVLVEDPICHTFVAKRQAESLRLEDQTYYFCSDECRKTFINNQKKGA